MITRRGFLKGIGGIGGSAFVSAHAATLGSGGPPPVREKPPYEPPLRARTDRGSTPAPTGPAPAPTTNPPIVQSGFTIQRTNANFASFDLANAAAQDGDTILVAPGMYTMQTNGWGTTKSIVVRSAVPGQRYVIYVLRNAAGAIGNGFNVSGYYRQQAGLTGRQVVTLEDAEIYADGLTYQTGSCAVFIDCRSNTCPIDFTMRRCFIHDWDQGVESGNEYDYTDRTSTVTIEDSIIYQTGDIGSGDNNHCIYIGFMASLTMKGCIVDTKKKPDWIGPNIANFSVQGPSYWPVGHLVKCRAKALTIHACRLTAEDTTVSNCIEYGNGGDLLVTGSILEQGSWSDSIAFVSYGRFFTQQNQDVGKGHTEINSKDGRTNRIRIYQNTFVNSDTNRITGASQQYVELSYQVTQAEWTRLGLGMVPADMTLTENQAIENNIFVDSPAGKAILPSDGYPGVGTQPGGVLNVVGIPCAHAINNTANLQYSALVDINDRYAGWKLKTPTAGSIAFAPFALRDVAVANYKTSSPTTLGRKDGQYGALRAQGTTPAWYAALAVDAWSHLPVTAVNDEIFSASNRNGIVWPSTGVESMYDATFPPVGGKHPIPGSSASTYVVFSGGKIIEDLTFVKNGVTYTGTYWVRYGGGHSASPDNSLHAIGPFDGTLARIAITDPSIPPAIDLVSDGNPQASFAPDGRPGAGHTYNAFAYIEATNTLVVGNGAGYNEGTGVYGYRFDEDGGTDYGNSNGVYRTPDSGWLKNSSYFASGPLSVQESAWMTDNVRGELWTLPVNCATPLIGKVSLTQGATPVNVEVALLDVIFPYAMYRKGWAIEGERWLVIVSEADPSQWYLIDRDYQDAQKPGRLIAYKVELTGDPLPNASGAQPSAGAAYDYEQRCFYVWMAGTAKTTVLSDVYKITPPATTNMATQAWIVSKITPVGGTAVDAPYGGPQWQQQTGQSNTGGWAPYGNFEFVPSPTRGLFYHHRLDIPPLFWKLS
jgi:hypothetical protein